MTQHGANLRGLLYVGIMALIAILTDEQVTAAIPPAAKIAARVILLTALTFRAYIDNSNADAKNGDTTKGQTNV